MKKRNLKNATLAMVLLIAGTSTNVYAQLFTEEVTTTIDNYLYPSLDWADYDNDGDKDLLISGAIDTTGNGGPDTSSIGLYNNDGGVFTKVTTPTITGLHLGFVKFMDIDNDGDQDILTNGQSYDNITQYFFTVYENTGSEFVEIQQLEGRIFASIDTGDVDNDGDLDILATGAYQSSGGADVITSIYTNEAGVFTVMNVTLPGVQNGNAQFVDLDTDQDLDIVITGLNTDGDNITESYINEGASFTLGDSFLGISYGSLAFLDFDQDEDMDMVVMGNDPNYEYTTIIYENNGGVFSEFTTLTGFDNFSGTNPIAWSDFDNDGDFDLILSGDDDDFNENTVFYENNANVFTISAQGLVNIGGGTSLGLVDFNGDNNIDIALSGFITDAAGDYVPNTSILRNNSTVTNLKPEAPQNLTAQNIDADTITFSWDNGTDDITPDEGLYYYLTVGTSENEGDVAAYKVFGNSWTLNNLDQVDYFWSVQSIDGAQVFSDKQNAQILNTDTFVLKSQFTLFPNPANGIVNVSLNSLSSEGTIRVINMLGVQVMTSQLVDKNTTIDVSALQTGVYVVNFASGSNQISKKLIIK